MISDEQRTRRSIGLRIVPPLTFAMASTWYYLALHRDASGFGSMHFGLALVMYASVVASVVNIARLAPVWQVKGVLWVLLLNAAVLVSTAIMVTIDLLK
jgi:hypothetical protein